MKKKEIVTLTELKKELDIMKKEEVVSFVIDFIVTCEMIKGFAISDTNEVINEVLREREK